MYEVFAVRYARRDTTWNDVFLGEHRTTPIGMDYFVWVIRNRDRTVVVDTGFTEEVGTRRGRTWLRPVAEGLSAIGVDAAAVEHVILTHFHYDHVGGTALFPRAEFHIQTDEMRFYTGPAAHFPAFHRSIEVEDVLALVRASYEGRVRYLSGDTELFPGITVHLAAGHTAATQCVSVATERGTAVLASDVAHYYRNFEENIPFTTLHDLPGVYAAFERLRTLASSPQLIIPGHDPLVLERLTPVGEGIGKL